MKKILIVIFLILFFGAIVVNTWALSAKGEVTLEDVNTLNFISKIGKENARQVKKICSYDYCDYLRGSNIEESLEIFTRNYLKTVEDIDKKAYLNVMGVKITSLVWEN